MTNHEQPGADDYNYRHFRPSTYDLTRMPGPRVGEPVPDLALTALDGSGRLLSDYRGRTLVIETGSVTCPMYAGRIPSMKRLASSHPDVEFIVVYVREAHPGHRRGPHVTLDDKRRAATTLEGRLDEHREILVDDLEGTAHRTLGGLPDMVYVIGPDGIVMFRGDWTEPEAVADVLDGSADERSRHREHFSPARPSPRVVVRTLLIGGWDAALEFVVGLPALLRLHRRLDRRRETA